MVRGDEMLEVVLVIILVFLSVLGLGDIMHRLWVLLIRPKKMKNYLITLLHDDLAMEQVTAVLEEMRWQGKSFSHMLIGVDMGLDDSVAQTLKIFENETHDFVLVKADRLSTYVSSLDV